MHAIQQRQRQGAQEAAAGNNADQQPNVAVNDQAQLQPVVNNQGAQHGAALVQVAEEHEMMEFDPIPSPPPQPQLPDDEDIQVQIAAAENNADQQLNVALNNQGELQPPVNNPEAEQRAALPLVAEQNDIMEFEHVP